MSKKTVLVTGASRGIGRACALAFAGAGFHVFINCSTSIDELNAVGSSIDRLGGTYTAVVGNVGVSADVADIFAQIYRECGSLDVLVNNAGIAHIGLLSDMADDEWNRLIQTNLSSVFYCCRAAIPAMVSKKSGRIINISSMWGTVGASCEAAYSAAKSGVNGLTRALAKELAPSNIQVNALACGVIDTAMNGQLSAEEKRELADEIPAGRFGTPEEVAALALELACAPAYMTGQIIGMDGGYI
ncbi:3-oxoacyl-ACP reductase FabG [Hespellia stercorisuis]|uniref:3-oxoacyl-[acyl-carrier protein] reductase n=1 Tax=Hespellia stercorisuis DSM 15480 TaxID=1121950 RepID=A0A1M6LBP7_9FIRM|nr:3-oxoacyl-ACP reductase FabG [Hespellia stercorisuis]SHJ68650.1 3-oxoacyl-[acyl-carrier protein] reductase [Hespellia stercorisuis DSM 15480]